MSIIIILLLGISLILFLISFIQKDPYKELREEMDQLTFQYVQEIYQMKQRVKVLEEELLVNDDQYTGLSKKDPRDIHEIIKNQVIALSQQGISIEQIASQSSLSTNDVYQILQEYNSGMRFE